VAQGGDWEMLYEQLALQAPGLIGIHTNMPATVPPDIDGARWLANDAVFFSRREIGYSDSRFFTRMDWLCTGNGGSSADALRMRIRRWAAAWIIDHMVELRAYRARVRCVSEGLTRDDIVDNINSTG